MNDLDSRFLRLGDSFAQKFSKPGSFRYIVTIGASSFVPIEGAYTIVVKSPRKGGSNARQHNIIVRREGTKMIVEPGNLEIQLGDLVLWHSSDAAINPGIAVVGEGENGKFSSSALANEAIYSHAFGMPGTYEWIDAYRGAPHGVVIVKNWEMPQRMDYKKWFENLARGTLISISGDKASPDRVEIVSGQTVLWAVESAGGISITDLRLVRKIPTEQA